MTELPAEIKSPADELRAAAQKIRDAAAKATPGRWEVGGLRDIVHAPDFRPEGFSEGQYVAGCIVADGGMGPWAADVRGSGFPAGNAAHIALWHPVVALLVADLLEDTAKTFEGLTVPDYAIEAIARELAVARAINGEPS